MSEFGGHTRESLGLESGIPAVAAGGGRSAHLAYRRPKRFLKLVVSKVFDDQILAPSLLAPPVDDRQLRCAAEAPALALLGALAIASDFDFAVAQAFPVEPFDQFGSGLLVVQVDQAVPGLKEELKVSQNVLGGRHGASSLSVRGGRTRSPGESLGDGFPHEKDHDVASDAKLTVYEKPTCTTCRKMVKLLKEEGVDFDRLDYFIDPLPREKLVELLGKMGLGPREVLRKREKTYKELGLKDPAIGDETLLDLLAEHPELLERPIIEKGERAVLGRPVERVLELL